MIHARRSRKVALAAIVGAALALTGCGSGGTKGGTSNGGSTGGSTKQSSATLATTNSTNQGGYIGMNKFAELVDANKSANIQIKEFPNGTLGTETAELQSLRSGAIQFADISPQALSSVAPEFGIFSAPFLFTSLSAVQKYAASDASKSLLNSSVAKGIRVLGYTPSGFSNVQSKSPIRSYKDFSGLKVRVLPSPIENVTLDALHATPVSLAVNQVYLGLQQGVVDASTGSMTFFTGQSLYSVAKNLTLIKYECVCSLLVVSEKYWESLSKAQQSAISSAVEPAEQAAYAAVTASDNTAIALEKSKGVTVIDQLSDLAQLTTFLQSEVYPKLDKLIGPGLIQAALSATGMG